MCVKSKYEKTYVPPVLAGGLYNMLKIKENFSK